MRNKHRRVLYMTSEDETLNKASPSANYSIGFLLKKGFFLFGWDSCFILLFKIALITTIWSDKSFPQGLFQNHDNVLVSSLRKEATNMCVYVYIWMHFLQVGAQRTGCRDCREDEHRELRQSVTGTKMHAQSHRKRMLNEDDHKRRQVLPQKTRSSSLWSILGMLISCTVMA